MPCNIEKTKRISYYIDILFHIFASLHNIFYVLECMRLKKRRRVCYSAIFFSSHLFHFYDIGLPRIILINDFSHTLQHIVIQLGTVLLSLTRSHKNIRYIILFQQGLHMCFICRSINVLDICDLGIDVSKISSP